LWEDAGDFWLIFETRPSMRAHAALAATLWRLGRREEAVEHQRELLRLNPRDNQGLRYRQANWLVALESYDELEELFAAYAGDGNAPGFAYTRALAALARRGAGAQACALLDEARELNPHIPAYLTGRRKLPRKRPAYTVFAEESEAVDYAAGAGELWGGVPVEEYERYGVLFGQAVRELRTPAANPNRGPRQRRGAQDQLV
jgi:tetratricopeptide (TPR) repeat protein